MQIIYKQPYYKLCHPDGKLMFHSLTHFRKHTYNWLSATAITLCGHTNIKEVSTTFSITLTAILLVSSTLNKL